MSNENADSIRLRAVISAGAHYGKSDIGAGKRVLVEFVSAQPNTVLTVTHGRGGVVGDAIAALLAATGHDVQREFYVNDAQDSRPMRAFARAVLAVYRQRCGVPDTTPETEGYNSDYIASIAGRIYDEAGDAYKGLPTAEAVPLFLRLAFARTQQDQRNVLDSLEIHFDNWTSESELASHGAVSETLNALLGSDSAEEKNGAVWLRSTRFGEPHDHVLRRADGTATYLAGDLAYHRGKFERGFDRLIDVWNADHSTYVSRTRAGIAAMAYDADRVAIVVFQRVRVLKDGAEIKGGRDNAQSAVPLAEVIATLGADETRFRLSIEDPVDLLDLNVDPQAFNAKNGLQSIKRAIHAARERSGGDGAAKAAAESGAAALETIESFPSVVAKAAADLAPQYVARYVTELAARIAALADADHVDGILYAAGAITLENALVLLGISPGPLVIEPNS